LPVERRVAVCSCRGRPRFPVVLQEEDAGSNVSALVSAAHPKGVTNAVIGSAVPRGGRTTDVLTTKISGSPLILTE
jgi:hypothetical protein